MSEEQANRMSQLLDKMNWNQTRLGEILGISQPAAGKIVRGETMLKRKHALKINEQSGINIEWLLTGSGLMTEVITMLNEPEAEHKSKSGNASISPKALQDRFAEAIDRYMSAMKLKTYTDVAGILKMNQEHMNNVRGHHKDLSLKLVIHLVKYGNINANYVLCGKGPVFQSEDPQSAAITALQERNKELENDKRNLQLLVDALSKPVKRH